MERQDYFVSQEKAERILVTFGINSPTPLYERRLRADGLRLSDLSDVLGESRFVFEMDWRGFLDDFVEAVLPALEELGAPLSYLPDDDRGQSGTLSSPDGRRERIQYLKAGDDFGPVVRAFQRLVPPQIEFRASPGNYPYTDTDGWAYAVLPHDEWEDLEALHRSAIRDLFIPLPPRT